MKRKLGVWVLSFLLLLALVVGCSDSNADDVTVESASDKTTTESQSNDDSKEVIELTAMTVGTATDSNMAEYQAIVDGFNETNEFGVKIKMEFYENEQYKTKLTTLMASNAVPDIFFTWELAYLEPFVNGGKVADITSYLEADADWKNSFAEGTLDLLKYDSKNYAIPTQKTLTVMFYNKELFEASNVEVPKTYDEFLDVCEKLKNNDITPMAMSGTDSWIPAQFLQQISNGIGGLDLFNGIVSGEKKWNDPAHIEAAQEVQKMIDAGYFQDGFIGMGPEESIGMFENGKAGMYFMGAWDASRIAQSSVGENVGVFTLPAKNIEYKNISVGSVDTSFAISSESKHIDAAVAFLKYWTSEEREARLLYEIGRMPAGVFEIDESKLDPLFAQIINLSNEQKGLVPWWDRAFGAGEGTEFNNTCVAVSGGVNPQEVFDALQKFAEDNADR
jgi:raffinose/stachyose/melibiose transport system substrate-binding protein